MKTSTARAALAIGLYLVVFASSVVLGSQPPARTTQLPTGISMGWSETGAADGPAVIFLHGFTDTRRSFAGLVADLTQLRPDLRLITVDLRGHGSSTLPFGPGCRARPELCFTVAHHAADVVALMDRLGIVRADLVGHSLGTLVAQTVALDAPVRVRRLVLIGGAASTSANPLVQYLRRELVEGEWSSRLRALGYSSPDPVYQLPVRTAGAEAEAWIRSNWAVEAGVDPALLSTIADEALNLPFGTWIGTLRALETTDLRGRLGQLAAPTLVIWGVQDQNFPEEPDQVALRQALAASSSTSAWWKRYGVRSMPAGGVTDDHGHNLHWAAPAVVARDLAAFLRDGGVPTTDRARVAADSGVIVESGAAAVLQLTP